MGRRSRHQMMAFALIASFAACEPGAATRPQPIGTITMTTDHASLPMAQGGQDSMIVTIDRTSDVTGTVTLSIEGAPAGITATVSQGTPVGNTMTAKVVIRTAWYVAPGTYTILVRASGSSAPDAQTAITLPIAHAPSLQVFITPTNLAVARGGIATVQVSMQRVNFPDSVFIYSDSLPPGIISSIDPPVATGTSATVTLTIGTSVAPGHYVIWTRVSAGGQSMIASTGIDVTAQ